MLGESGRGVGGLGMIEPGPNRGVFGVLNSTVDVMLWKEETERVVNRLRDASNLVKSRLGSGGNWMDRVQTLIEYRGKLLFDSTFTHKSTTNKGNVSLTMNLMSDLLEKKGEGIKNQSSDEIQFSFDQILNLLNNVQKDLQTSTSSILVNEIYLNNRESLQSMSQEYASHNKVSDIASNW